MEHIKGTEIDLRNIMWIYRLKNYYSVTGSRIYAYLIPINYRLKTASINRMVQSGDSQSLMDEITGGPYGEIFTDFENLELKFGRAMHKVYMEEAKKHPDSLAVVANYLFEKEMELHNITTILEGVRYGLPAMTILSYLSLPN